MTHDILRNVLRDGLAKLGVETCGTFQDHFRRSGSDLATDLAAIILTELSRLEKAAIEVELMRFYRTL